MRSRIGDATIFLFESNELAQKLREYDEEYRFTVSRGFNVTLKGGARGDESEQFSDAMKETVVTAAATDEWNKKMNN